MACPWNIDYGDPDPQTGTVLCRCHECKKFADLYCDRDFATGALVVQVMTCVARGGHQAVRDAP
jgi:hypothetical protein